MFFLIPTGVDYRTQRLPIVTFIIMGLCTAIYLVTFLLFLANGDSVDEWVFDHLWLTPAYSPWWAYVTSMFVHEGFFHLLGNMLYLFLFGCVVEDIIGRVKYVFFYLLAGLGAAFAEILVSPEGFTSEIPFGGASGAITGCIAGFLLLRLRSQIDFKWIFILFFRIWTGEFTVPAWLVISFWFGSDLLFALLAAMEDHSSGGVAFAAHVGGFLCGLGMIGLEKALSKRAGGREKREPDNSDVAQYAARIVSQPDDVGAYYLHMNGDQAGPFTASQVDGMIQLGAVADDAHFWTEGMDDWQHLSGWATR